MAEKKSCRSLNSKLQSPARLEMNCGGKDELRDEMGGEWRAVMKGL